jgi:asparagine synthase (glutamine-hydrolysing)
MVSAMRHEDFYVGGEVSAPELGVWAGWNSHPGSFASRVSAYRHPDGSCVLFSGECFPTDQHSGEGPTVEPERFAADLIEASRRRGERSFERLNGLFSAVVLDRTLRRCLVVTDRYGCERVHYRCEPGTGALFASEAKAILRASAGCRRLDVHAVAQLVRFGTVLGNGTLFDGVSLLPPATVCTLVPGGEPRFTRYFDPAEWESSSAIDGPGFQESLAATLARVVPRYARDDAPVGLSVTGGLDTRMVLAALSSNLSPARCYTFGPEHGETLDQRIGRAVSSACGFTHVSLRLGSDWLRDFREHVDRTVWVTDGCAGATTAHEIYFNRLARSLSPVRLTGNFGSEILRSVSPLGAWRPAEGFLQPEFGRRVAALERAATFAHPVSRAVFEEIPRHPGGAPLASRSLVVLRTPFLDNDLVRLAFTAPAAALQASEASLGAVRRLRPALASIPTDRGLAARSPAVTTFVRRACAETTFKLDYLDKDGLPGWLWPLNTPLRLLRRTPMMGLHKYLPYRTWFMSELQHVVAEAVHTAPSSLHEFLRPEFLATMPASHASGRQNLLREIALVMTLASIDRTLLSVPCPMSSAA